MFPLHILRRKGEDDQYHRPGSSEESIQYVLMKVPAMLTNKSIWLVVSDENQYLHSEVTYLDTGEHAI